MKGVPCNLYLISIDIGAIAGTDKFLIWKIGITKKDIKGKYKTKSRYSGEVGDHISILRQRRYKDSRDAFMIEQTILMMNNSDYFRSRKKLDGSNKSRLLRRQAKEKKSRILRILEDKKLIKNMGRTEWIFSGQTSASVMQLFDQLTSYGEFHGDGNISYTPFRRDQLG